VVLLDVPVDVASARRAVAPDGFEAAGAEFHRRVAEGFGALAVADPERGGVIDGEAPVDVVAAQVWAAVELRLPPG
jgi:dTMP kinase